MELDFFFHHFFLSPRITYFRHCDHDHHFRPKRLSIPISFPLHRSRSCMLRSHGKHSIDPFHQFPFDQPDGLRSWWKHTRIFCRTTFKPFGNPCISCRSPVHSVLPIPVSKLSSSPQAATMSIGRQMEASTSMHPPRNDPRTLRS